ncbi:hypothetical protein LEN26_009599 [Aphanomyces euteiches]|nr:hypothetical protein AeMF1_005694 [Aphanomyces euteiches]KAH9125251.1 hypothetical protein LEN26_009599 [Aphanomyces euteiches]KAH9183132.1 hypothetical protein AeNC1_014894 [Aphanomyces euteiches]
MASSNNIFHGQAAFEPGLKVKPHEYEARPFDEDFGVEIKVTHCSICGSDLNTITGGWGPITYPMVVGHEIVGHVTRMGSKVDTTKYAIGTRVGVGAQCGSCLDCNECNHDRENLCDATLGTYNGKTAQGYITQGGYADYYRCHYKFAVPIPEALSSESAAPMALVRSASLALGLVATEGKFVLVGAPEKPLSFAAFSVVVRQITFAGSTIGSPSQIEEMLAFAVEKGVNSIVEVMPMAEAAAALQKVHDGRARFRIVLKN